MATKAIRASYLWTVDEMVVAQKHHLRGQSQKVRWLRFVALGSMIFVLFMLLFRQGIFNWGIAALVGLAYVGVLVNELMRHPKVVERSARRLFARHADQNKRVTFVIDETAVSATTEDVGESRTLWDNVQQVRETDDGFLLYLNKQLFLWIPRKAIQPQSDLERLRQIIAARGLDNRS